MVNVVMDSNISHRVCHVPGVQNEVADAISRGLLDDVCKRVPGLRIFTFTPPWDVLGVAEV